MVGQPSSKGSGLSARESRTVGNARTGQIDDARVVGRRRRARARPTRRLRRGSSTERVSGPRATRPCAARPAARGSSSSPGARCPNPRPRRRLAGAAVAAAVEAFPDDGPLPSPTPRRLGPRRRRTRRRARGRDRLGRRGPGRAGAGRPGRPTDPAVAMVPSPARRSRQPRPKARRHARWPAPAGRSPLPSGPTLGSGPGGIGTPCWSAGVVLLSSGRSASGRRRQRLEDCPRSPRSAGPKGSASSTWASSTPPRSSWPTPPPPSMPSGVATKGPTRSARGPSRRRFSPTSSPRPWTRLLEEAATYRDPKEWPSHFAGIYRGRSVILDAPIAAVPDPTGPARPTRSTARSTTAGAPSPKGGPGSTWPGSDSSNWLEPKLGEQKPFGARLASMDLDPASNEWVLTFEPDSGVFITHPRALEAIGWPPFEPPRSPDHDRVPDRAALAWSLAPIAGRPPSPSSRPTWPAAPNWSGARWSSTTGSATSSNRSGARGTTNSSSGGPTSRSGCRPAQVHPAPFRAERPGPGTLRVEDGRLVCRVSAIELLPADLDRLEKELGRSVPTISWVDGPGPSGPNAGARS